MTSQNIHGKKYFQVIEPFDGKVQQIACLETIYIFIFPVFQNSPN